MDTSEKLHSFLKSMDYGGKIPAKKELKSVCNPKTEFVWEQLIGNVQRQEKIKHIRNNRLISELSQQSSNNIVSEIKNIVLWKKKREFQKAIAVRKEILQDKENELQVLSKQVKIKEIKVKNIKEECNEKLMKHHMMDLKYKQLKEDVNNCKKLIKTIKTPEECNPCKDNSEVSKTLKACIEKLAELQKKEFPANSCLTTNMQTVNVLQSAELFLKPRDFSTVKNRSKQSNFVNQDATCRMIDNRTVSKKNEFSTDVKPFQESAASRELLKALKSDNDCVLLWKNLESTCKGIKTAFLTNISNCQQFVKIGDPTNTYEYKRLMAKLYSLDVSNKLRTLMQKNNSDDSGSSGRKGIVDVLEEELEWMRNVTTCDQELNTVLRESAQVEEKITSTVNRIKNGQLEFIKKVYESQSYKRQRRFPLIVSLQRFAEDNSWFMPLTQKVASDEIEAFVEFPLNYYTHHYQNRNSQNCTYLPVRTCETVDSFMLYTLYQVLQPQMTVEHTLVNLCRRKMYLNILKTWKDTVDTQRTPKYTYEELRKSESFISEAIEMFNKIAYNRQIISAADTKDLCKMWLEIPFNSCVLPSRVFNEQRFQHYNSAFNDLYLQIPKENNS